MDKATLVPTGRRWREVARFEARLQRREFLTGVYVAVFFFLTFGYTSSEVVELVGNRETIPRNAPWALAHAMAGVTAFGQVITTMITATAVMRDVATRQQELLFTTPLSRADYLMGRWAGALVVMLAVYAAIPIGLIAGTQMPWVAQGSLLPFEGAAYLRPLLLLVLPNVLVVSALFFTAGALGRSFMTILLLGVALVALWSSGLSLVRDGIAAGALLDPFGNAALEASTRGWSSAERAARAIPVGGVLLVNRVLWFAIGAAALVWLLRSFRFEVAGTRAAELPVAEDATPSPLAATAANTTARTPPSRWVVMREAGWTCRWTLRERGFGALAFLGTLNALSNALRAGGATPNAGDVLGAVVEHSRFFLILVATIYAGELVWRERDVRVDALRDTLPAGTSAMVAGRVAGLLAAQAVLVLPLLLVGLVVGWLRGAEGLSAWLAVAWVGGFAYAFLAQLTMLSLLLHALVQHKVAGHVLLIVGWVLAVALERSVPVPFLLRYGNLPPYTWSAAEGFGGMGWTLAAFVVYWSAVATACAVLASVLWVRGVAPAFALRLSGASQRLRGAPGMVLSAALAVAAAAWWSGIRG